jgi:PAS domain S-box-containing protein
MDAYPAARPTSSPSTAPGDAVHAWVPDPAALNVLADVADLGYFQVDQDRNLVGVSPALERITGFRAEEVLGRSCLNLIRCQECLQGCGVFRNGEVHDHKMTLYRKDGTEIQVSKSGRAITDDQGNVVGAVEAVKPVLGLGGITGIGSPELDLVLGSLGRYYLIGDEDLRVMSASSDLPDLLGIPADELEGLPLEQLLGEELFGRDSEFITSVLAGRRRERWQVLLRNAEGKAFPASVTVGPLDEGGHCGGFRAALFALIRLMAPLEGPEGEDQPRPVEIDPAVTLSADELAEAERIREALARAHYSRSEAAALLGISRTTLWRRMREFGLE